MALEKIACYLGDDDATRAAAYLCRWGGSFAVVHRPERLSELLCAMTASGVEPKRLRLVCPRAERAPSLILVEGRRGGKPGLTIEPPLILQDEAGADSEAVFARFGLSAEEIVELQNPKPAQRP